MLTILMGRAKTGKSEQVLRRIGELGDSSRQILLVPEHASHQAEVDLCRACGDTASRHAEVLSFRRLCDRVLTITGGAAQVTLDAGGKLLTLQKALGEVAPLLKVYRRPSQKASFLQQLLDLFDELRCYDVSPELLESQAREIQGATRDKLLDLSLLYGAYESRLYRPGLDARDRMTKLCEALESSRYASARTCLWTSSRTSTPRSGRCWRASCGRLGLSLSRCWGSRTARRRCFRSLSAPGTS